jgi:hypothetical protein
LGGILLLLGGEPQASAGAGREVALPDEKPVGKANKGIQK